MSHLRQEIQTQLNPLHPLADPLRHAPLSLSLLWQAIPPKVRHEEAHLCSYRYVTFLLHQIVYLSKIELSQHHRLLVLFLPIMIISRSLLVYNARLALKSESVNLINFASKCKDVKKYTRSLARFLRVWLNSFHTNSLRDYYNTNTSSLFRRKTTQLSNLRQVLLTIIKSDHAHAQASRCQTICLRRLWRHFPA